MARVPGSETPSNRAGFQPGEAVRCRRCQANADRGLLDRRGFVAEVRPTHVLVLLDADGRGLWLESEAVLSEPLPDGSPLELLRRVYLRLSGQRIEMEEGGKVTIFSTGFPAEHLVDVQRMLGSRLAGLEVLPQGVHEIAVLLTLRP